MIDVKNIGTYSNHSICSCEI